MFPMPCMAVEHPDVVGREVRRVLARLDISHKEASMRMGYTPGDGSQFSRALAGVPGYSLCLRRLERLGLRFLAELLFALIRVRASQWVDEVEHGHAGCGRDDEPDVAQSRQLGIAPGHPRTMRGAVGPVPAPATSAGAPQTSGDGPARRRGHRGEPR